MQSRHHFWPSGRKLFRQRSRLREVAVILAAAAAVFLTVAVAAAGWR